MIVIFILIPFCVLSCSVISVLVASHFFGYNLTASIGIFSLVVMVISLLAGIALGSSQSRKDYIEALQDFYDRTRDVPERARKLSIKEAKDALYTAAIFDTSPLHGFVSEAEWQGRKNLNKPTIGPGGGGEEA